MAQISSAGHPAELIEKGQPEPMAAGTRLAVYRVVQETIARGESLLAPAVTRHLIGHFATRIRASDPAAPEQDHPLATLTQREREVLTHIAAGLSNAEIAGALVISPETVKTYVSRILAKLGLRDRVQAVVLAYRTGLVSAQD